MKIAVSLTVEIDPEDWTTNYGIVGDQRIREDVKNYVVDAVESQLVHSLCTKNASVTLNNR